MKFNILSWIIGIIISLKSFILLLSGILVILGNNQPSFQSICVFILFSLIIGFVSAVLYSIKPKIGFFIFILGLIIGFFEMFRMFINGMGGWGDLTGLMSLLIWSVIGLISAAAVQFIWYLYKKFNRIK
ncbi:MAG: hypothetical protein K0S55_209 [Clostridia bacterium]|jgi:hypothetical protein|nr:hypothetical protein [Clostridia bacterium]